MEDRRAQRVPTRAQRKASKANGYERYEGSIVARVREKRDKQVIGISIAQG